MSNTDISAIEDMPVKINGLKLTEADLEKKMFKETKISINDCEDNEGESST